MHSSIVIDSLICRVNWSSHDWQGIITLILIIYIRVLKIFSKSFFSIFFWYYISSRFYKISVDETTSLSILEYHHLHDFRTKRELNLLDLNPRSYQFIILINYFSSRRNFNSFMRSFIFFYIIFPKIFIDLIIFCSNKWQTRFDI